MLAQVAGVREVALEVDHAQDRREAWRLAQQRAQVRSPSRQPLEAADEYARQVLELVQLLHVRGELPDAVGHRLVRLDAFLHATRPLLDAPLQLCDRRLELEDFDLQPLRAVDSRLPLVLQLGHVALRLLRSLHVLLHLPLQVGDAQAEVRLRLCEVLDMVRT
eukprot:5830406-Prymnesium_polylepis.1